jgi:tRNA-splicing ligase RtcB
MNEQTIAHIRMWLAAPLDRDVSEALERLRRAPDVQRVAVMPDVHLAADVCVGVVVATSRLLYPQAVGGDIGCGMLAVAFDIDASALNDPRVAGDVLAALGRTVPSRRRNRRSAVARPADVDAEELSDPSLETKRRALEAVEFATLGSGNHFVELQADESNRLWLMVHSGSRGIGPAIRDHHMALGTRAGGGLRSVDAFSEQGAKYLHDAAWARRFADASRKAMALEIGSVVEATTGGRLCWDTSMTTDHNHVARERHGDRELWVHRKGAMAAMRGVAGVLPGSMGGSSFHVEGRGHEDAMCSSAHGAGRALSRTAARAKVTPSELRRQMQGVWFDYRLSAMLRDEAPSAYKDIRAVLRAQRDLVRVTRELRPVLSYKGT